MHDLSQALTTGALLPGSELESGEGRLLDGLSSRKEVSFAAGTRGTLRLCLLFARHLFGVPEVLKPCSWRWF